MITVPVAAPTDAFKWQISFFQFAQERIYGRARAENETLLLVVDRNNHTEIVRTIPWSLELPHQLVRGIHSILPVTATHQHFVAGNVFFALKDVVSRWSDDEILCIVDADIVPLKQYAGPWPDDTTVITCNYYEDWHMRCSRPDKEQFIIAYPYLTHAEYQYMDGGFVPILVRVKTLKRILDDVIATTIRIVEHHQGSFFGWWSQMLAFQVVCHNHRITCVGQDNTYFPGVNQLRVDAHSFAHYSCDVKFNKKTFPHHDLRAFPDDVFYRMVREWRTQYQ